VIDFEMMDQEMDRGMVSLGAAPASPWRDLLAELVSGTRTLRVELALQDDACLPALWTTKVEGLFGRSLEQAHCAYLSPDGSQRTQDCASCPLRLECAYPRLYDPGLILPPLPGGFERARPLRFVPVAWGPGSAIFDLQIFDPAVSCGEVEQAVWSMSGHWLGMLGVAVEVISCGLRLSPELIPWREPGALVQFVTLSSAHEQGREALPEPFSLVRASLRRAENLALQQGLVVPPASLRHDLEDEASSVLKLGRLDLREGFQLRQRSVPLRGVTGRAELLGSVHEPERAAALIDLINLAGQLGIGRFTHFGAGQLRLWV